MEYISFTAKFAGIPIKVQCFSQKVRDFCADYITDAPYVFSISLTADDIAAEASAAKASGVSNVSDVLHEIAALHRKISEILPLHKRLLIHGAAITYKNDAYIFCAPSGTGKTTHISLWKKFLGKDVGIINGDKPFLSFENENGQNRIMVCGSPWAGKELWQENRSAPLRAVCFITRSRDNRIIRLSPKECLPMLMRQIYIPRSTEAACSALELTDNLLRSVPVFQLTCDMSEDAVKCSFETLTELPYPTKNSR